MLSVPLLSSPYTLYNLVIAHRSPTNTFLIIIFLILKVNVVSDLRNLFPLYSDILCVMLLGCRFIPVKLGNKLSSACLRFKINYNRMNEEAEARQKQMIEEKKRKNTRKK